MNEKIEINFQNNDASPDIFLAEIEAACEGLNFMSETDAPVLPFVGHTAAGEPILLQPGACAEEPMEEAAFDAFFGRLTQIKDYYGEPEKAMAQKFLELKRLLEENLSDLKVFRIGRTAIDIYAVGVGKDGRVMGVATKAVET
ncbi:nuclease A inhibitor family protein [soil metagenome]